MKPKNLSLLVLMLSVSLLAASCGGGDSDSSGKNDSGAASSVFVSRIDIPPGSICPAGGVEIQMGFDNNGNNVLDADEVVESEYVCNGVNGEDVDSLNVSGSIAPGNFLALQHNLNRNDLSFNAQFVKDGWIYDYTDYQEFFDGMTAGIGPVAFEDVETYHSEPAALSNGNIILAYTDGDSDLNYGTFRIYDTEGTLITGPTVFKDSYIDHTNYQSYSVTALPDGNALIAYRDPDNASRGTLKIFNQTGTVVAGPTVFETGAVGHISAAQLAGGKALIAYEDWNNSNYGTFVIVSSTGSVDAGPTVFESAVTQNKSVTALKNGNAFIAYQDKGNSDYGTFVIYDSAGTLVKGPTVFESAVTQEISATTLTGGNVLIAYRDFTNSMYGTLVIYNQLGTVVASPRVFNSASTDTISATALANGMALITYMDGGNSAYGTTVIYDAMGNLVAGPDVVVNGTTYYSKATATPDGKVFFAFSDETNSYSGNFIILQQGLLKLEKVNSNEVRLHNYTGETLNCTLSLDQ